MIGRGRRLLDGVRGFARSLLAAHASPGRLAAAVLVGTIVGCSPLFGLHLWICVALAGLLGLNLPTMYAAANISVPPAVPLLGFASVQLGERLIAGRWLPLALDDFRRPSGGIRELALRFFCDWLVGGALVGAAIGAVLATAVYLVARRRELARAAAPAIGAGAPEAASTKATEDAIGRALAEATRRYRAAPPKLRHYARFKYRLDPAYRRLAALVPDGAEVVDLGTGLGMLPLVLALLRAAPTEGEARLAPRGRAIGVDWDRAKLAAGRAAAAGLDGIELVEGDLRDLPIPACDAVVLLDVLHYFDAQAQRDLLGRCVAALRPGGRIFAREGDARRAGGARITRALEWLAVRLGWNRAASARFRSADDLERDLRALGLQVTVEPLAGPFHPGNVLLSAGRLERDETMAPTTASKPT